MKKQSGTSQYALCLAAVCLLVCGLLLLGVARARFSSSVEREVELQAQPLEPLLLTPQGDTATAWQMVGDTCMSTFLLQYDNTQEQNDDMSIGVVLLASLGIETPEALDIRLTVEEPDDTPETEGGTTDGADTAEVLQDDTLDNVPRTRKVEYRGIPEEIPKGSALWYSFGDGWLYRFCPVTYVQTEDDGQLEETQKKIGREVTWKVGAETLWQTELTVTVKADANIRYDVLLRLCAEVRSEKGNE